MTFLPIVERELRVQARQKKTFRLRLAGAGAAIAFVSFMLVVRAGFSSPSALGHWLFTVLAWMAFPYCLLSGVASTADCLSREKREGTLGLLFLTDLKGYDVVLGKLLATSLNNFYGLLAIFPPLALTFCLGGVTGGEFWRLTLVLTNTLFFSLAGGMFISALSRDEQRAVAGALGLMVVSGVGPVLGLLSVSDTGFTRAPNVFWGSLLATHGAAWVLLALASRILPGAWQDQPVLSPRIGQREIEFPLPFQPRISRAQERSEILAANPVLWLAGRQFRRVRSYLWVVVLLASGLGWAVAVTALVAGSASAMWGLVKGALVLHFLLAVFGAFQASYVFAQARSSGTLEALLCTSLSDSQIVEGYFLGLRWLFARPITFLLSAEGLVVFGTMVFLIDLKHKGFLSVPLFLGAGFAMLWLVSDLFAVGRVGMWMGLRSRQPSHGFLKTVLYVTVLPLFSLFCCSPLTWLTLFLMPVKNALFRNHAQEKLRREFRATLTEGLPAKPQRGRLPSVLDEQGRGGGGESCQ